MTAHYLAGSRFCNLQELDEDFPIDLNHCDHAPSEGQSRCFESDPAHLQSWRTPLAKDHDLVMSRYRRQDEYLFATIEAFFVRFKILLVAALGLLYLLRTDFTAAPGKHLFLGLATPL